MAVYDPTPLERLVQGNIAKYGIKDPEPYKAGYDSVRAELEAKYDYVKSFEGTGTSVGTAGYVPYTVSSSTATPSSVRPPMTIADIIINEEFVCKLLNECVNEFLSPLHNMVYFANHIISKLEVTYDGDFRLRIKE